MKMEQGLKGIEKILRHYDSAGGKLFEDSVSELCGKGIGKGCFQDYTVLTDIIGILSICENIIKSGNDNEVAK